MKKFLFVLPVLVLVAFTDYQIDFKKEFKPQKKYVTTVTQTSQTVTNYSGSVDFMQALKDKGIENPTIKKKDMVMESVSLTGKQRADSSFPITVEYTKINSSDESLSKQLPNGTTLYGNVPLGHLPVLDSIVSPTMSEEMKQALLPAMQNIFSQFTFPEKKMNVGDQFSNDTPISIPLAGTQLQMGITTTYRLTKIRDGIATFDIAQVYKLNTEVNDHTVTATGNGGGIMLYDIANGYYTDYKIDSEMSLKTSLNDGNVEVKVKMSNDVKTIITDNL